MDIRINLVAGPVTQVENGRLVSREVHMSPALEREVRKLGDDTVLEMADLLTPLAEQKAAKILADDRRTEEHIMASFAFELDMIKGGKFYVAVFIAQEVKTEPRKGGKGTVERKRIMVVMVLPSELPAFTNKFAPELLPETRH